jgi:hypothetical protein
MSFRRPEPLPYDGFFELTFSVTPFKRGFSDIEFQVVPNDVLVPVQQVMTMCPEDFREERATSLWHRITGLELQLLELIITGQEYHAVCSSATISDCVPTCNATRHGYELLATIDGTDTKFSCNIAHGLYSWVGAASEGGYLAALAALPAHATTV